MDNIAACLFLFLHDVFQLLTSDLNLVVASTDKKIGSSHDKSRLFPRVWFILVMVEAASSELPEDVYFRAVELGFEEVIAKPDIIATVYRMICRSPSVVQKNCSSVIGSSTKGRQSQKKLRSSSSNCGNMHGGQRVKKQHNAFSFRFRHVPLAGVIKAN